MASAITIPSFLVVFRSISYSYQQLPKNWVCSHFKMYTPTKLMFIKTSNGYQGQVEIKWDADQLFFSTGWGQVVRDLNIQPLDILRFTLIHDNMFDLTVFDNDLIEKAKSENKHPMFIRWFIDIYEKELVLPMKWCEVRYVDDDPNHAVYIKTKSGYRKVVEIVDDGAGITFTKGWSKLVKRLDLHPFTILLFNSVDDQNFEMVVYLPGLGSGKRVSCFNFNSKKYKWRLKKEKSKMKPNLCVSYGFKRFRKENRLTPGRKYLFNYCYEERSFYLFGDVNSRHLRHLF
ncbi:uncharacterized protein [Rutidosis leptorrhynchoides]|uniref:uncharacterized protein n=1 Tax=Rutidosis leptorrhynchoides TaxID=125765 RepID=UPI003A98E482